MSFNRKIAALATTGLLAAVPVAHAQAQNNGTLPHPCSPSTGCVTDGKKQWQAPQPPPLTEEEARLYDKCEAGAIAAGLSAVDGGWLAASGVAGQSGVGDCKELQDKYQKRVNG